MKYPVPSLIAFLTALTPGFAAASSAFIVQERVSKPTIVMTEVSTDEAYEPEYVKQVLGFTAHDTHLVVPRTVLPDHVILAPLAQTAMIILVADFGYHARPTHDEIWRDGRKSDLPGTDIGLHAIKESVNILQSAPATLHPHGLELEIVPQSDPLALKRGDVLKVQVLLHGKPLPGVELQENFLSTLDQKSPPTDARGFTTVRIQADQFNVIQLTYEEAVKGDPDVDFFRYNSALTFNLAGN